jgi:hypothetical protein
MWGRTGTRVHRAAGHVGEHAQRRAHHHHRHDRQAVQAVGEVHRVARADDHQVGEDHEAEHAQRVADLLEEGHQQAGLGRQVDVEARAHPGEEQLQHAQLELSEMLNTRYSAASRPITDCQKYFSRERMPSGSLLTTLRQSSTQPMAPKPIVTTQHDPDEAVRQVEPQQRGEGDGEQHQHAAHGGRAALGQVRLHAVAAHRLADLQRGEPADHPRAGGQADQQRGHRGHHGAEGEVLEHAQEAEFRRQRLQPFARLSSIAPHASLLLLVVVPRWPARRAPSS